MKLNFVIKTKLRSSNLIWFKEPWGYYVTFPKSDIPSDVLAKIVNDKDYDRRWDTDWVLASCLKNIRPEFVINKQGISFLLACYDSKTIEESFKDVSCELALIAFKTESKIGKSISLKVTHIKFDFDELEQAIIDREKEVRREMFS